MPQRRQPPLIVVTGVDTVTVVIADPAEPGSITVTQEVIGALPFAPLYAVFIAELILLQADDASPKTIGGDRCLRRRQQETGDAVFIIEELGNGFPCLLINAEDQLRVGAMTPTPAQCITLFDTTAAVEAPPDKGQNTGQDDVT